MKSNLIKAREEEYTGYKTCRCCKQLLDLSFFGKITKNKESSAGARYRSYCHACHSNKSLLYYYKNKEKKQAYQREYAKTNRNRIKERPDYIVRSSVYSKRVREAQPTWLDRDQKRQMTQMYVLCRELNVRCGSRRYNVDHIIPINSNYVCGLHVPWNLQVLDAEYNNRKNNSIDNILLSDLYTGYVDFEITEELLQMIFNQVNLLENV